MTALAAPLPRLLPCPGCAGGGELNGLPCRECGGKGRQVPRPRLPASWRKVLHGWADAAARPAGVVVGRALRWSAAVPGVAGAAAVSIGAAMIVHGVFHQVPGVGVAAAVGGLFCLLMDRNL